jgi:hypothetical protein
LSAQRHGDVQLKQTPHAPEGHGIMPWVQEANHLAWYGDAFLQGGEHHIFELFLCAALGELVLVECKLCLWECQ